MPDLIPGAIKTEKQLRFEKSLTVGKVQPNIHKQMKTKIYVRVSNKKRTAWEEERKRNEWVLCQKFKPGSTKTLLRGGEQKLGKSLGKRNNFFLNVQITW